MLSGANSIALRIHAEVVFLRSGTPACLIWPVLRLFIPTSTVHGTNQAEIGMNRHTKQRQNLFWLSVTWCPLVQRLFDHFGPLAITEHTVDFNPVPGNIVVN